MSAQPSHVLPVVHLQTSQKPALAAPVLPSYLYSYIMLLVEQAHAKVITCTPNWLAVQVPDEVDATILANALQRYRVDHGLVRSGLTGHSYIRITL